MNQNEQLVLAKGIWYRRIVSVLFLLPAWFSPHTRLRAFFHKLRGVKVGSNVEIGYFVIIGNVNPDLITICEGATITARCTILEHDNAKYYTGRGIVKTGNTVIGKKAFIGIGSVIMPGVTIGERSIIGALSVVTKSTPNDSIYVGSPAHPIN